MRTFLAVQLPNDLKEKLMQIIRQLGPYRLQGHFSTEENLHLTLEFIGETTKIAAIKQAMQQIEQYSLPRWEHFIEREKRFFGLAFKKARS